MANEQTYIAAMPQNDPDAIAQVAINYLKANVPGWEPSGDAVVEVWLITALSFVIAMLMDLAGIIPDSIFRAYGQKLLAPHLPFLAPINAAPARVVTTWTAIDGQGYTIKAGTSVGYRTAGDAVVEFTVDAAVTIPPGETVATGVALTARIPGAAANGLATDLVPIDDYRWVSTISPTGTPSGGTDAETDRAYLNRLSLELELLAPRPILPADFAKFALNSPGVATVMAIDGYRPPRVITDAVTVSGDATLTSATARWTPDDEGATLVGTGIPGATTVLSYVSSTTVEMSHDATSSGAGRTVTIGAGSGLERCCTVAVADPAGDDLTTDQMAAVDTLLQAQREVTFMVGVIGPTRTGIDVAYVAKAAPGNDPGVVQDACDEAITAFLAPINWGGGPDAPWPAQVLHNDIVGVLYGVTGVQHVTSVTLNGDDEADVTLAGVAPLPQLGTITPLVI